MELTVEEKLSLIESIPYEAYAYAQYQAIAALHLFEHMKVGTFCPLKLTDIDLTAHELRVKTQGRFITLHPETRVYMARHLEERPYLNATHDYLFVSVTGKRVTYIVVKKWLAKMGESIC